METYFNLKSFLDNLNTYSNLLIAILTLAIVYLAFRSLISNRESLRLNALPILFPKIYISKNKPTLILENHSNYPAYDIDIWVFATYLQSDISYKKFLADEHKKKVKINFSKTLYNPDDEFQFFSIVDHIVHYAFPPKTKCIMDLDYLYSPETVELVLQFRDSMGFNYLYQGWLFVDTLGARHFKIGSLVNKFKPARRIEYLYWDRKLFDIFSLKNIYNYLINKIIAYFYLEQSVRDLILRSFPSGYQKGAKRDVEGRGIFEEL